MKKKFIHPLSIVESKFIGKGTRVWAFTHIQKDTVIGNDCNIGENCFIENGVTIGDRTTIKNGVQIWEGIRIKDDVFIGSNATFTNDRHPRSPRASFSKKKYKDKNWITPIIIEQGCTIGANATIVGPVRLGKFSFIAAGSVVIKSVKEFELVAGNPASHIGFVNKNGERRD